MLGPDYERRDWTNIFGDSEIQIASSLLTKVVRWCGARGTQPWPIGLLHLRHIKLRQCFEKALLTRP